MTTPMIDAKAAAGNLKQAAFHLQAALDQAVKAGQALQQADGIGGAAANLSRKIADAAQVAVVLAEEASRFHAPLPTCPGCSGHGQPLDGYMGTSAILTCQSCGGIYTRRPIRYAVALGFVNLNQMQVNASEQRYFDLDVFDPILADGTTTNRIHGWFDVNTKRVVQFG